MYKLQRMTTNDEFYFTFQSIKRYAILFRIYTLGFCRLRTSIICCLPRCWKQHLQTVAWWDAPRWYMRVIPLRLTAWMLISSVQWVSFERLCIPAWCLLIGNVLRFFFHCLSFFARNHGTCRSFIMLCENIQYASCATLLCNASVTAAISAESNAFCLSIKAI